MRPAPWLIKTVEEAAAEARRCATLHSGWWYVSRSPCGKGFYRGRVRRGVLGTFMVAVCLTSDSRGFRLLTSRTIPQD